MAGAIESSHPMPESAAARVTRASQTNFYYAFQILPPEKRQAIYALYSFCRKVDDCVDEPGGEGEVGLARWMQEVDRAYAGTPTTELGRELAAALARFPIPWASFDAIVAGCRMDLAQTRYETYADLRLYCERVAGAVGRACIEIFGYRNPAAREYAMELGVALQLTNVLRDVAADVGRGRLYLPAEDLVRFGVAESEVLAACDGVPRPPDTPVGRLLAFEGARAMEQYARAEALLPAEDVKAMAPAQIMGRIYRAILDKWIGSGRRLGGTRVRISTLRKGWIVLTTLMRPGR